VDSPVAIFIGYFATSVYLNKFTLLDPKVT